MPVRFWVLSAVYAILPDLDIIGYYYGIKYGYMLGHRGFFHSLSFALLMSVLVVVLAFPAVSRFSKKWWGMLSFFFVVTASHGFLDSMTDKGMGWGSSSPSTTHDISCPGVRSSPRPCAFPNFSAAPALKS
jgi:inner membrane protein